MSGGWVASPVGEWVGGWLHTMHAHHALGQSPLLHSLRYIDVRRKIVGCVVQCLQF